MSKPHEYRLKKSRWTTPIEDGTPIPFNAILRGLARDLKVDELKALRTYARFYGQIGDGYLADYNAVGDWLGNLAPEIAAQMILDLVRQREEEHRLWETNEWHL